MAAFKSILKHELMDAYRKWKSSVYFDPFLAIDANRLAFFELENNIREESTFFENFADELINENERQTLFTKMYKEIGVRCFPKNNNNAIDNGNHQFKIISNVPLPQEPLKRIHYQIDLPVKAQILGVLWVMKFGRFLDLTFDEQCYGNRIRKTIINGNNEGPTPYLYYPYFQKYESWRDEAIKVVEKLIDANVNALMVSLDITGYFYNCRVNFTELNVSIKNMFLDLPDSKNDFDTYGFLIDFVENIFREYTNLFRFDGKENGTQNPMIPIGFLPSYVISNWYLSEFDNKVREIINPQYYGRYVDDMLLVFSFDKSYVDNKAEDKVVTELSKLFNIVTVEPENNNKVNDIGGVNRRGGKKTNSKKDFVYEIKSDYLRNTKHTLILKNQKIKAFYFSYDNSKELIQTFKKNIAKHSSAFFFLQETDERVLQEYSSDIWEINYSDSLNKIRSVENLSVNKFELSRWLAFLNNYAGDIDQSDMGRIIQILFETLNGEGCLLHFNLWEKYLSFFFKHSKYPEIKRLCEKVVSSINNIKLDKKEMYKGLDNSYFLRGMNELILTKDTLKRAFRSIIQKVFSLRATQEDKNLLKEIEESCFSELRETPPNFREAYLKSYMFNTILVPFPLINYGKYKTENLFSYCPTSSWKSPLNNSYLLYYPRYVHLHEVQLLRIGYPYPRIKIKKIDKNYDDLWEWFWTINYGKLPEYPKPLLVTSPNKDTYKLNVGEDIDTKEIQVGIANVRVSAENFESNLRGFSLFTNTERKIASKIINTAIKEKVDFLVLPECYVHYSWIGKLIRVARDHQMGMVFGLEYVVDWKKKVAHNYLVTILPFKLGEFNNCFVEMRLKNYPSPSEKQQVIGHSLKLPSNRLCYAMYSWKGFCFAPYSCFEIACIEDRSVFKSKIDALVTVEWNKDIDYFSNIIESLTRDLHCYCIQVNSSEFGDNRITRPSRREIRDIVQAKGGENDYLIVGKINIEELRNFQIKDHPLQIEKEVRTEKFKPIPPGFDPDEVKRR